MNDEKANHDVLVRRALSAERSTAAWLARAHVAACPLCGVQVQEVNTALRRALDVPVILDVPVVGVVRWGQRAAAASEPTRTEQGAFSSPDGQIAGTVAMSGMQPPRVHVEVLEHGAEGAQGQVVAITWRLEGLEGWLAPERLLLLPLHREAAADEAEEERYHADAVLAAPNAAGLQVEVPADDAGPWPLDTLPARHVAVVAESIDRAVPATRKAWAALLGVGQGTPAARAAIARGLGRVGDESSLRVVRTAVRDDSDAQVRLAACAALGVAQDPRAVVALGAALADATEDVDVRRAAAEALGVLRMIDDTRTADALHAALADPATPDALRQAVAKALENLETL